MACSAAPPQMLQSMNLLGAAYDLEESLDDESLHSAQFESAQV